MSLLQRSQPSAPPAALPATAHGSCLTGFISDLLLRCGRGDEEAFALLFDTIYPLAHATTATRVAAQDVDPSVQAAFVSIWEDAPLYRLGAESSVSWIMRHVTAASQPRRRVPSPGSQL